MNHMKLLGMPERRISRLCKATGAALMVALTATSATAAPKERYAWLDKSSPHSPEVVVIHRGGKAVAYSQEGLLRCDVVEWKDPQRPVLIRLSDGRKFLFTKVNEVRQFKIPCDQPAITETLMMAINAFLGISDTERLLAAASVSSRSVGTVKPLSAPLLDAERLALVAKRRPLHLRWAGGQGPFEVLLVNTTTTEVIARRAGISSREVTLPAVELKPGAYRLQIRQFDGSGLVADDLVAVAASDLPAMPQSLQDAQLTDQTRAVLYADYLASRANGLWRLEAAQRMAEIAPVNAAARSWLQLEAGEAHDVASP